ncbi:MAG: V-type ATPase 116kDa subunit family protein [bacterium]
MFALGLATSVIAVVVNTFMGLLGDVPIVGVVLMPLVFLAGHFFNLVISSLGAFIHSARLQYVEYFSKFYAGGGRAFSPFRLATRYVEVEA